MGKGARRGGRGAQGQELERLQMTMTTDWERSVEQDRMNWLGIDEVVDGGLKALHSVCGMTWIEDYC